MIAAAVLMTAALTLATTGPQYFDDHEGAHFMSLAAKTDHKRMVMGGDCYNYALLASGHVDVICEAGLKLHDWAALVPVDFDVLVLANNHLGDYGDRALRDTLTTARNARSTREQSSLICSTTTLRPSARS